MINMRCGKYILAAVGVLMPMDATGQDAPRCFEVVAVGSQSRMQADTLILTKEPYSRGMRGVVWWQAFLESAALERSGKHEALPWRPIGGDSVEVQLPMPPHPQSRLIVQDSGSALRGYMRVMSDEVGAPDPRYDFVAEEIPCVELVRKITAPNQQSLVAAHMSLFDDGDVALFFTQRGEDGTRVHRISAEGDTVVVHPAR